MLMLMPMLKLMVAQVTKKLSVFYFKLQTYQTDRQTDRQTDNWNEQNAALYSTATGRAQWIEGREGKQIFVRKMDGWMDE